ncbi:uncharacterized protein BYT42DRAFT_555231 [Radiomyces spectabilis]|uniref:uncharacterized protein n=1 Tax=Radiomyces spectabilis TaxID=64574 RepID=UPI002220E31A|nr:uncharacterized protein BYT42DRAFT_555231 [Radiomyces spectabilis]KAI8391003.1 hypothetical protein BYT42DRAFT_555231 [Radiomyces spectabilis]
MNSYFNSSGSQTQTGGGFFSNDSSDGNRQPARKPASDQTIRPVTLKQLANVTETADGSFQIDGVDTTQITFVAVLRNVTELATNISYTMEDGTGAIEVRRWVEQNETASEAQKRRELIPDTYVRVAGRINSFNHKTSVVAFLIRPITDFNEISYHFLDAVYTHVNLTKGSRDSHMQRADYSQSSAVASGNQVHNRVLETLKEYRDNDEGAHVEEIIQKLQSVCTEGQVREAIEYLTNEGHCYQTIDENHIKSTDS